MPKHEDSARKTRLDSARQGKAKTKNKNKDKEDCTDRSCHENEIDDNEQEQYDPEYAVKGKVLKKSYLTLSFPRMLGIWELWFNKCRN